MNEYQKAEAIVSGKLLFADIDKSSFKQE